MPFLTMNSVSRNPASAEIAFQEQLLATSKKAMEATEDARGRVIAERTKGEAKLHMQAQRYEAKLREQIQQSEEARQREQDKTMEEKRQASQTWAKERTHLETQRDNAISEVARLRKKYAELEAAPAKFDQVVADITSHIDKCHLEAKTHGDKQHDELTALTVAGHTQAEQHAINLITSNNLVRADLATAVFEIKNKIFEQNLAVPGSFDDLDSEHEDDWLYASNSEDDLVDNSNSQD